MAADDPTATRRLLRAQVADLATGVGLAIRTARRLHLPVEPGVREGREALVRWTWLLDELDTDATHDRRPPRCHPARGVRGRPPSSLRRRDRVAEEASRHEGLAVAPRGGVVADLDPEPAVRRVGASTPWWLWRQKNRRTPGRVAPEGGAWPVWRPRRRARHLARILDRLDPGQATSWAVAEMS